ncbi:reverse transcriptase domain-containing protein [Tanacetum coccineum]
MKNETYNQPTTSPRPKIKDKDNFELKGQFLKELRTNTFSSSDHEDANENTKKVLEIVDLFHIPNITIDQVMLRAFLMSLTGAASCWLRNEPTSSIRTWDGLKTKFLNKYCPLSRTANKVEEINNFQKEPDENLYQAWERFKELLMKCPQHYLTEMQEVILSRSTETFDGLATIQAQLNNLGREIKKVNEKVYAAQVGCEQCKGPYYTKDFLLKEEGKTLEDAYYTQFGDYDKKIHIDCAHNLKFSCMIGFEITHANFFLILYVNVMSKKFHNSIMKEKLEYKGNNIVRALMNMPIFVGTFSVMTDFAVLENMDDYRNEGIGVVIFGEPFLREVGINAKWFERMITIYNGDDEVTYQMVRSHPKFKNHTNEQCNKILPLLKVSEEDKMNGISHLYQKLKGFYKGVLNLRPDYIQNAKTEEWITRGHISVHEME